MASPVSNEQLKTFFAAQLRLRGGKGDLVASYDVLVPVMNSRAYNQILAKLLAKGYSRANIDAWDELANTIKFQATYYLFHSGAQLQADDTWPEKFNILETLDDEDFVLLVDGELVDVEADEAGISYGKMTYLETVEDTFIGGDAP